MSKLLILFNFLLNPFFDSLVTAEGFEPSTLGAEIRYSIQLNYECI